MVRVGLGREIRALRESAGLTLRDLAGMVRCSASHLCDIEHGRRTPSDSLLRRISEILASVGAQYRQLRPLKPVIEKDIERWYAANEDVRRLIREVKDAPLTAAEILRRVRAGVQEPEAAASR